MADRDTDGLPDVDLGPVIDDLQAQQDKDQQDDLQQRTSGDDDTDKSQDLDLGQFKNPKDMLKSYKEVQGAFTKVTQDNKSLKEEIAELKEKIELGNPNLGYQQTGIDYSQQATGDNDKSFDQRLAEQPEETIQDVVARQVSTQSIAEVFEEENEENPAEFQERYAYVKILANQYPQLARSSRGVRKLFKLADKTRAEQTKKSAYKSLEHIFGGPLNEEQLGRLKNVVLGDNSDTDNNNNQTKTGSNAYMPDGSTSYKKGSDTDDKPDRDREINEAVAKGDVDAVLDAQFRKNLEE